MMKITTPSRQRATRATRTAARTGSTAGAAGSTAPRAVAPRTGAGIRRTFGSATLASAQFWPVQSRRNRVQHIRRELVLVLEKGGLKKSPYSISANGLTACITSLQRVGVSRKLRRSACRKRFKKRRKYDEDDPDSRTHAVLAARFGV